MNQSLIDRYRRWFEYEKDSHAKTLASLKAVSDDRRQTEAFRKAVYLMGHIVAARRMWLFRLGVTTENADLFPGEVTLAELPDQISEMEKCWTQYLAGSTTRNLRAFSNIRVTKGRAFAILSRIFLPSCSAIPGITAGRLRS
jgi:uncharacterized damage-inducible protein DinB